MGGQVDEERIAEAFDRLDSDNTGSISKENIMEFLSDTDTKMEDVELMIRAADIDDCGEVSFDEFLAMFRSDDSNSASLLSSLKQFSDTMFSPLDSNGSTGSDSDVDSNSDDLVGIDAVIPGGKHDTLRDDEA